MKWIGQHIWDFISRFRNDVYLEDIDSGTIASGSYLGLDSNNKVVKNTISTPPDLTVDGAGTINANNVPTLNQDTTGNAATATIASTALSAGLAKNVAGNVNDDVAIVSDGEVIVKLDSDNDEDNQKFKITNNADTEVAYIDESGNMQIDGDLTVSGNDIKDSGGNSIISSDGSGVVTMAGGNIAVGGSNANFTMNAGSDIVLEADQNGGGGDSTIQYPDSAGTKRIMLAADNDVVILSNRASNGTVQIRANTSTAGSGGETTVVTVEDDEVTVSQLLTAKQRHVMRCGFVGSTTATIWLPFNYGGTFDATSSSGYLEYGGVVMPADGYVESVIIRSENVCGNSIVAVNVAGTGTEVPFSSPGSFASGTVNMSADDTAYKFTGFTSQGGGSNSFNAGDVVMISFNSTGISADTTAVAVIVLDWNNAL